MTAQKLFKARVRARMARTGERYAVARAQLTSSGPPADLIDAGWALRGGTDPDAAALTHLLAHQRVLGPTGPLSEDLVFLIAGGLGAGYILWEFRHDDSRHVVLGFSRSWNYLDRRLSAAVDRLGLDASWSRSGGAAGAAAALRTELDAGHPVVVWPDRYTIGYWQLPETLDGHGGHPVVAYSLTGDRIHLDDRTLAPLTVAASDLDRARTRVGSYRHALFALQSEDVVVPEQRLQASIRAGLRDTVEQLGGSSESFAAPAWRKWSRLLVDTRGAKAWPRVFADGRGLFEALLSVWEGIEPAGMAGGHLRGLFADGLRGAGAVLGDARLSAEAEAWSEIAESWHLVAEAAAPVDVATFARARELVAVVTGAVAEGDRGAADRASAAAELWRLRDRYAQSAPLDLDQLNDVFTSMSVRLAAIYEAETAAVGRLAALLR